jgi:hypothetical protein
MLNLSNVVRVLVRGQCCVSRARTASAIVNPEDHGLHERYAASYIPERHGNRAGVLAVADAHLDVPGVAGRHNASSVGIGERWFLNEARRQARQQGLSLRRQRRFCRCILRSGEVEALSR